LSYFNRVFLKKKQMTPSEFRRGKLLNWWSDAIFNQWNEVILF
jgi:AraC-like DNA-binding protein